MQIKQRSYASLVLAVASICAACMIWLWHQNGQLQAAARQSWQVQLASIWEQQAQREMQALKQGFSTETLKNIASSAHEETQHISLKLPGSHSQLLASELVDDKLPIPANVLQEWLLQPNAMPGFFATDAQSFHWIMLFKQSDQMHLVMRSASATLKKLHEKIGGDFSLKSPWELTESCADAMTGNTQRACTSSRDSIELPLFDINHHLVAHLVWRPLGWETYLQSIQQQSLRNIWMIGLAGCALLLVILIVLAVQLQPIDRGISALNRLIQGDVHSHIDETHLDGDGDDEQAQLFHALHTIRNELIQLETLRQEKQRLRVQHERLIRTELRKLADSLDSTSRDEILQSLAHKNPAPPHETQHQENTLAELAGVLGRMSGLVSTQQNRLLKLLKELQASMQTQAVLASLQQELEIARQMQLSILPRHTPEAHQVHIDALMLPAKEVGGDFYDYFMIDEDQLAVVVADVSGKGVPAAFFMAISRTLLKSNAMHLESASQTISQLNNQLCAENDQMMFVTVFYAVLQLSTGKLRYVNAGHNPPLLKQQNGTAYLMAEKNMALAVLEEQTFSSGELTLMPGDSIILYTDGVTEATDTSNALFGEARLLDAVTQHAPSSPELPSYLLSHIRDFEKGAAQADDITIVSLQYLGEKSRGEGLKT